nr:reverse transcriptase domain-containing protein [Tanacetum cinerariifolium]
IAKRRVLPRGLTLNLFGFVMIVVSMVILGTDVQRRLSKKKLEKRVVELMLLRMLSLKDFMDTRFSAMLDIDLIKIGASYEVELDDGRLGTFDVIIGMDWLAKHDVVIVCGESVVRIPYGNEMLIVESDKGVSRLTVISCI